MEKLWNSPYWGELAQNGRKVALDAIHTSANEVPVRATTYEKLTPYQGEM